MTHLEITHYTIECFIKNFKGILPEPKEWVKTNLIQALRLSFGNQFNYSDYAVYLALTSPFYGVLTKDYKTLKALKTEKRVDKFKHSKVNRQTQLKLSKLDINTKVLILLEGNEFSNHRLTKILKHWQPIRPVILLG
jgi:hypothetical protein